MNVVQACVRVRVCVRACVRVCVGVCMCNRNPCCCCCWLGIALLDVVKQAGVERLPRRNQVVAAHVAALLCSTMRVCARA